MVAKIKEPKNFRKAIYYNEHKVEEGKAECIWAENFLKTAVYLSIQEKMHRFNSLVKLNEGITYNTLHISLNFHPSEQFSKERLAEIAGVYMQKIGFGDQPFLVYQHNDTPHPHVHIVTTTIREDGTNITIHNIARDRSEPARKEIELAYNLVQAESRKKATQQEIKPLDALQLQYGKTETKRGINNVLDAVLSRYTFNSLEELNAILSLYHVRAFRGNPGSRTYNTGGLLYQLLDTQGRPAGIPIKASSIYSKPTLAYLKKEFEKHHEKPLVHRKRIQNAIDLAIRAKPDNFDDFARRLKSEQVYVVARMNKDGIIYGLTFVDTKNKAVFNGSDIGRNYSAAQILAKLRLDQKLARLSPGTTIIPPKAGKVSDKPDNTQLSLPLPPEHVLSRSPGFSSDDDPFHIPLRPLLEDEQTPAELLVDKKRKRNQKPTH